MSSRNRVIVYFTNRNEKRNEKLQGVLDVLSTDGPNIRTTNQKSKKDLTIPVYRRSKL